MNLVCFYYKPPNEDLDLKTQNDLNEKLLNQLNATGKIYLTHTKVQGVFVMRISIGQTNVQHEHIRQAWDLIQMNALELLN